MRVLKRRQAAITIDTIAHGFWSPVPADTPITHIIDIGANVGAFSLFARMRWPRAKILAIEPDGAAYVMLLDNMLNLDVATRWAAFGKSGMASIADPNGPYYKRHFSCCQEDQSAASRDMVPSLPLSFFAESIGFTPADALLLKIDVEGAEHFMVDSPELGLDILKASTAIAIEIHPPTDVFPGWFTRNLEATHDIRILSQQRKFHVMHAVKKGWPPKE